MCVDEMKKEKRKKRKFITHWNNYVILIKKIYLYVIKYNFNFYNHYKINVFKICLEKKNMIPTIIE